jgi:hypothetical protein
MLAPVVYAIMLVLVQWFPSEHPLIRLVKEHPDPWFFALSSFSAVLVAPIVEEFLFRVLLQGWLETLTIQKLRKWFAPHTYKPVEPRIVESDRPAVEIHLSEPRRPVDELNPYVSPAVMAAEPIVTAEVAASDEGSSLVKPPPLWPTLVSSAIFALLHWGHGPDPIPLFVLALGLGYLYRQTHRVLPGIVVHMLLNAASMAMLLLSVYGGK